MTNYRPISNLLRVVANTVWGADKTVLLRLYRSLVRSGLNYGSVVFGSARKSYIQMLDPTKIKLYASA